MNKDEVDFNLIAEYKPAVEIWDTERNALPLFEAAYGMEAHLAMA